MAESAERRQRNIWTKEQTKRASAASDALKIPEFDATPTLTRPPLNEASFPPFQEVSKTPVPSERSRHPEKKAPQDESFVPLIKAGIAMSKLGKKLHNPKMISLGLSMALTGCAIVDQPPTHIPTAEPVAITQELAPSPEPTRQEPTPTPTKTPAPAETGAVDEYGNRFTFLASGGTTDESQKIMSDVGLSIIVYSEGRDAQVPIIHPERSVPVVTNKQAIARLNEFIAEGPVQVAVIMKGVQSVPENFDPTKYGYGNEFFDAFIEQSDPQRLESLSRRYQGEQVDLELLRVIELLIPKLREQ
jgi:hypothetical protein